MHFIINKSFLGNYWACDIDYRWDWEGVVLSEKVLIPFSDWQFFPFSINLIIFYYKIQKSFMDKSYNFIVKSNFDKKILNWNKRNFFRIKLKNLTF